MAQRKRDVYAFGDDPMVEDGDSVRVPVMVCDSLVGNRPGHLVAPLTDEQIAERLAAARRTRSPCCARTASGHAIQRRANPCARS